MLTRDIFVRSVIASLAAPLVMPSAARATEFKRVSPIQFIAANIDPTGGGATASSGTGADTWGIWRVDPGPRGVRLRDYPALEKAGGVAPAKWRFDSSNWWLEVRRAQTEDGLCG
jgi:hypothetical protein